MLKKSAAIFFILFSALFAFAQEPEKPSSGEIFKKIQKLNFLGSVLYIAAHPDDENTRLISDLSNHHHARVAYLSITRGDGGQNLIGSELSELLGLIRTHELLEARKIDGAEQFFTRAVDFGYSKHSDETMRIWNEQEILSDIVYVIRTFRPDVIINRFDHRSPGTTHGHHTASAILGLKAFDLAADSTKYPEQIQKFKDMFSVDQNSNPYDGIWQAKRICFNTSWWFYGSKEAFDKADKSKLIEIPTGGFDPITGYSNNEVSALSRSMHKSQGFGNTGSRGETTEYLEVLKGDIPLDRTNLFEGINTTWSRVEGGERIGKILAEVEEEFDFKNPAASVPKLMEAEYYILRLKDIFWRSKKYTEIVEIISDCLGLFVEVNANKQCAPQGSGVKLSIELINRSEVDVQLNWARVDPEGIVLQSNIALKNNIVQKIDSTITIPLDVESSSPVWLRDAHANGSYKVPDNHAATMPVIPTRVRIRFSLKVGETDDIEFFKEIVFKENDPVLGEVYKPFEILPPVSVGFSEDVYLFRDTKPQEVEVVVRALSDSLMGLVSLNTAGMKVEPESVSVSLMKKDEVKVVKFMVTPHFGFTSANMTATVKVTSLNNYFECSHELTNISYSHIPYLTAMLPASAKAILTDLKLTSSKIAYIEGAGDNVPEAIRQMGCEVKMLESRDITTENLKQFDAVVLGIRAYNTIDDLNSKMSVLFGYVKSGGTMIVQYNTNGNIKVETLAPAPLKISRDRVTEEDAVVTILDQNHPLMNAPNKITDADFEGWVQERGLYFPNEWDTAFVPLLACHDSGEKDLKGSLLVMNYGDGVFIYTGLSFFRELPGGVPGAYRLFANLLSAGDK